jgi:hypothetical protein
MSWRDLEASAPEIASLARESIVARGAALLGTIRADGWPRISPVEPAVVEGELVFGLMPSPKLDDLRASPRCVLHNLVTDSTGKVPEVKLTGRAIATARPEILGAQETWWAARAGNDAVVFTFEVDEAAVVSWDLGIGRMRVRRWRPGHGAVDRERAYP